MEHCWFSEFFPSLLVGNYPEDDVPFWVLRISVCCALPVLRGFESKVCAWHGKEFVHVWIFFGFFLSHFLRVFDPAP